MQRYIQRLTQVAVKNKKTTLAFIVTFCAILAGVVAWNAASTPMLAAVGTIPLRAMPEVEIAIAGMSGDAGTNGIKGPTIENSWPGELVSLGSVPVQPVREGTIASWNVHIGQKVFVGQVLGTLSRPPAMPDTIAMLAEEEKMVTMARVNADAKRVYTKERILQLEATYANTKSALDASRTILGVNASTTVASGDTNFSMIEAKRQGVRAVLRSSLAKTYPKLSTSEILPTRWSAITLKDEVGVTNSRLRNDFPSVLFAVLTDLGMPDKLPLASGLAYFDLTIKLVDASAVDLAELKSMLHEDQEAFIMAIDKLREAELMAVDTEKMSFEQLRMIDSEIAMLKQELAMAEGDVVAKEASYRTVRQATEGASVITASAGGVISSILKKPGEFVEPGMPVAIITSTKNTESFVRIRFPNNIKTPKLGEMLSVARSGFSGDVHKAKLIGVGNALDENGSVMADALLLEPTSWPVGASLRVMAPRDTGALEIPITSLWWDAKGDPNVWVVSDAGRVYAKRVLLGRTLGEKVEIYDGLLHGDRYVLKPTPNISEDMLLDDLKGQEAKNVDATKPTSADPHASHAGMEM